MNFERIDNGKLYGPVEGDDGYYYYEVLATGEFIEAEEIMEVIHQQRMAERQHGNRPRSRQPQRNVRRDNNRRDNTGGGLYSDIYRDEPNSRNRSTRSTGGNRDTVGLVGVSKTTAAGSSRNTNRVTNKPSAQLKAKLGAMLITNTSNDIESTVDLPAYDTSKYVVGTAVDEEGKSKLILIKKDSNMQKLDHFNPGKSTEVVNVDEAIKEVISKDDSASRVIAESNLINLETSSIFTAASMARVTYSEKKTPISILFNSNRNTGLTYDSKRCRIIDENVDVHKDWFMDFLENGDDIKREAPEIFNFMESKLLNLSNIVTRDIMGIPDYLDGDYMTDVFDMMDAFKEESKYKYQEYIDSMRSIVAETMAVELMIITVNGKDVDVISLVESNVLIAADVENIGNLDKDPAHPLSYINHKVVSYKLTPDLYNALETSRKTMISNDVFNYFTYVVDGFGNIGKFVSTGTDKPMQYRHYLVEIK